MFLERQHERWPAPGEARTSDVAGRLASLDIAATGSLYESRSNVMR
jgi:hypothetical protein